MFFSFVISTNLYLVLIPLSNCPSVMNSVSGKIRGKWARALFPIEASKIGGGGHGPLGRWPPPHGPPMVGGIQNS